MSLIIEMPRYIFAVLEVEASAWALKIKHAIQVERGTELHFEDERFVPRLMSGTWAEYHQPVAGGYLVVFEDGREAHVLPHHFNSMFTPVAEGDA